MKKIFSISFFLIFGFLTACSKVPDKGSVEYLNFAKKYCTENGLKIKIINYKGLPRVYENIETHNRVIAIMCEDENGNYFSINDDLFLEKSEK